MKKSELRKLIREVISEQVPDPNLLFGNMSTACNPTNNPNCVPPELVTQGGTWGPGGNFMASVTLKCPEGFVFQGFNVSLPNYGAPDRLQGISYCVPDIGSPGDMAGHGSPDDPFVPGMGFEDQFIDQITGPGGPFGGSAKSGGSGKGKPIRESKKRRK